MSDEKSNVSDKASEIAKNIWLAGLGAYGRAFDEAQERIDKATKPPRLFKDLVKKGAKLEDEVKDSLANIRKSRTSSVEERISKVRENFNLNLTGRSDELAEINAKLDKLTRKVDALAKAMKDQPATRTAPPRKTATRKAVAGKSAPRKASPHKKPAAKK